MRRIKYPQTDLVAQQVEQYTFIKEENLLKKLKSIVLRYVIGSNPNYGAMYGSWVRVPAGSQK